MANKLSLRIVVRVEYGGVAGEGAVELEVPAAITVGAMKTFIARHFVVASVSTPDLSDELEDETLQPLLIEGTAIRVAFPKDSSPRRMRARSGGEGDPPKRRDRAPRGTLAFRSAIADATCVLERRLYVGGQQSSRSLAALRELGITHVLNLCDRVKNRFTRALVYRTLSVSDSKTIKISTCFAEAFAFIDECLSPDAPTSGACLVHCLVGASRSVSVCIAYLVARQHMCLYDAFVRLRSRRSCAMPNKGFRQQLIAFECDVAAAQSAAASEEEFPKAGGGDGNAAEEGGGSAAPDLLEPPPSPRVIPSIATVDDFAAIAQRIRAEAASSSTSSTVLR